jgi:hypothetical protein
MNNMLNPFFSHLAAKERQHGYFEHTAIEKFMLLYVRCLRTVISEGLHLLDPLILVMVFIFIVCGIT